MSAVPNIRSPHPSADALHALAARAVAFTDADGLAIALDRGAGMVCEASIGIAPAIGEKVGPGSVLSEKCIREATTVTYTREADATGDAYSTILAPIMRDARAIGLCAAFANRANAFTDPHLAVLTETAAAVCRYDDPRPVPVNRETEPVDTIDPRALNPEIVKGLEAQIAEFAVSERRRVRIAIAVKCGVVALLVGGLGASLVPDRVTTWVAPILERLHHSPNQQLRQATGGDRASR
jgi:hypothetical protein